MGMIWCYENIDFSLKCDVCWCYGVGVVLARFKFYITFAEGNILKTIYPF